AIDVLLGVLEREGIDGAKPGLVLLERALVGEQGDPLAGGDAERVAAARTHAAGAVDLGPVHDLLAGVALDPESFGDGPLRPLALFPALPEPGHGLLPVRPSHAGGTSSRALREAMKAPSSSRRSGDPARDSRRRITADPTITPSAIRPTAAA